MPRIMRKQSKKAGLPPGALVHIGEERKERVAVSILEYNDGQVREEKLPPAGSCYAFKEAPTVTWVNVTGIHQVEVLRQIGDCFQLHPLVLEDILNGDQRPKVEPYGNELFIVLKMLTYDAKTEEVNAEQVSLIIRPQAVLSFQEGTRDLFRPIQERILNDQSRLRKAGADYLAYALLDLIVDYYFTVLEKLEDKIEAVEERLVVNPSAGTLREIQSLKRNMIFLRKWLWPLREVLSGLERGESPLIQASTQIYLRDVYDHTIQVIETAEILRDMLSGMVDIYLSSINNRLNGVIKVLTIIATIFMPLTFIAGVYGMNFKHMPELEWRYGYALVLLGMAAIAGTMPFIFRKKKWL